MKHAPYSTYVYIIWSHFSLDDKSSQKGRVEEVKILEKVSGCYLSCPVPHSLYFLLSFLQISS